MQLTSVKEFRNLNALLIDVKFEGENLGELFYQHKAKWHKLCHLKFAASKVERVKEQTGKKRECDDQRKSRRSFMTSRTDCIAGKFDKFTVDNARVNLNSSILIFYYH